MGLPEDTLLRGNGGQIPLLDIAGAADRLRRGGVVIYPTETFFGVGCRITDAAAVTRVYQAKRRNVHLPLPVICGDRRQLDRVAAVDAALEPLLERFWPGSLTVLLPARACVPETVTAGTGTVAARLSPHAVARTLALAVGEPLVSSSANISGRPAVTEPAALDPELLDGVDGVLAAGAAPAGGLPSTLVRMTAGGRLRVLRVGAVAPACLEAAGFPCVSTDD
ncbi:MAG: threonylcarbamoyl-AMP synthase [Desulfovibrionaceae bacterium]|nr:threonylcarbamoyl-AMP synthase [Desulfovibrionaceae bacterium]